MNQQTQIHVPQLTQINKYLIIISASIFILGSILAKSVGFNIAALLGLSASSFSSGFIHQLITYPFVSSGLLEVIFESLILWFIGSELESMWGKKRFLQYLGTVIIGSGLIYLTLSFVFFSSTAVFSLPLTGLAGIVSAMCVSYAVLFPDKLFTFMFLFPIKAKYFCGLLAVMSLYTGIFTPMGAGAWGHLASMLCGFGFMVYVSKGHMNKGGKEIESIKSLKKKFSKKAKSHLTLVESEEDEKPPKYWQ